MARSVYVAGVEGFTGKSAVALGVLEQLSRRVARVAVFRPVVRAEASAGEVHDYVLDLLVSHDAVVTPYDDAVGVTYEEVHTDPVAAMATIIDRHAAVAASCDAVVVLGTDYTDIAAPTEFVYNARVAANLATPVLLVLNGAERTRADVRGVADVAVAELETNHAELFAVVVNRVTDPDVLTDPATLVERDVLVFAVPDEPVLSSPTVADLMAACDGTLLRGDETLVDELLDGVGGIAHEDRQRLALGGPEGVEHPVGGILTPGRPADADPHTGEVRRAERLGDVADAVVTAVASADLQLDRVERDVELIVHDDHPLGRHAVERRERGDGPARDVHEAVGLGQDELVRPRTQPRLGRAGVRLVRAERLRPARGELVHDELTDVVPRHLVARTRVAEPDHQPGLCHVFHPA